MIAYLDASALAKLLLNEEGSAQVQEVWASDVAIATSELSVVELACAVGAAVRARRLARHKLGASITDGTWLSARAELVEVDADLIRLAASLGSSHALRALDAVHVASALVLREAAPTLVSWDLDQRRAAVREGLPVYP